VWIGRGCVRLNIVSGGGLVFTTWNLRGLLRESWLISKTGLKEIGREGGRWAELIQDRVQGFGTRDTKLPILLLRFT
jgi:hypothetical protein